MTSKRLIRFDWAVKKLLRNKANFAILEGFLSELLFDDIRIEKILESEGNREREDDKYNRVDILTQNSKNEILIIEIQNTYELDFFQRMAYGAAKVLTENISAGQLYFEICKVISINIVYFDLGQGRDYIYKGGVHFQGLHEKDQLGLSDKQKSVFVKENVSDIFPEYYIIKVNQFNDVAKDSLDEWVYFLKNSEVRDNFKAKGLKEAREALDVMRLSPEATYGYNRYIDSLRVKAGELQTMRIFEADRIREETALFEKTETAKMAILEGFDDAVISKLTKLSVGHIQEIRGNMGKN